MFASDPPDRPKSFAAEECALTGTHRRGFHTRMREMRRLELNHAPAIQSLGWWWRSPERWRVRG
jgi:hypothetical protein